MSGLNRDPSRLLHRDRLVDVDLTPFPGGPTVLGNAKATKRLAVLKLDPDTGDPGESLEGRPLPQGEAWVRFDSQKDAAGGSSGATVERSAVSAPERAVLPTIVLHTKRRQSDVDSVGRNYPNLAPGTQPILENLSTPFVEVEAADITSAKVTRSAPASTLFRNVDGQLCILGADPLEDDAPALLDTSHDPTQGVDQNLRGGGHLAWWAGTIPGDGADVMRKTSFYHALGPFRRGKGTPIAQFGIAAPAGGSPGGGGSGGAGGSGGSGGGAGGGAGDPVDAAGQALFQAQVALDNASADLSRALSVYAQASTAQATSDLGVARERYQKALEAYIAACDKWYIAQNTAAGFNVFDIDNFGQATKAVQDAGRAVAEAFNALLAAQAQVGAILRRANATPFAELNAQLRAARVAEQQALAKFRDAVAKLRALGFQIEANGGQWSVGSAPTFGQFQTNPDGSIRVGGAHA